MSVSGHDPRGELAPRDIRPAIALAGTGLPAPLLIALAVVLAVALFLLLDARRQARLNSEGDHASGEVRLPPSPPPLAIPPAPPPAPPATVVIHEAAPAPIAAPAPPPPMRPPMFPRVPRAMVGEESFVAPPRPVTNTGTGPALVVDLTSGSGAAVEGGDGGARAVAANQDDTIRATLIHNRASVIPQGAIMTAVLETPLNSDRPGLARAIVSQDVRGFDGSRVLIPRGSRLIGEFKADASPGLRRILINWTRLIRPDGVAIRISSPVADTLGGAGVPGHVNTHFFARFSSAVLQSALAVGVNLASQIPANGNTIYLGLPSQAGQLGQQLVPNVNRPPTVKVKEGAEVAVIVAHDLDFSGTPAVR